MNTARLISKHEECINLLKKIKHNEEMIECHKGSIKIFEKCDMFNAISKKNITIKIKQRMVNLQKSHYQQLIKTL